MNHRLPVRVEPAASGNALHLQWSSGEIQEIPYFELRFQCPCANCVDEHTGVRTLKREQIPADVRPVAVNLVGRYALQVRWSDGHSTGMIHFDSLFELGAGAAPERL